MEILEQTAAPELQIHENAVFDSRSEERRSIQEGAVGVV